MRAMRRPLGNRSGTAWHWSNGDEGEWLVSWLRWIRMKRDTGSTRHHQRASLLGCHNQRSQRQISIASCTRCQLVPPQWRVRDFTVAHPESKSKSFTFYECSCLYSRRHTWQWYGLYCVLGLPQQPAECPLPVPVGACSYGNTAGLYQERTRPRGQCALTFIKVYTSCRPVVTRVTSDLNTDAVFQHSDELTDF